MRLIVLAALILTAGLLSLAAARDQLTGEINEEQLNAIKMTTIARFAGSGKTCPRFHVVDKAVFAEMAEARMPPEMLDTQEFKNAQALALLSAVERQTRKPVRLLFGGVATAWTKRPVSATDAGSQLTRRDMLMPVQ